MVALLRQLLATILSLTVAFAACAIASDPSGMNGAVTYGYDAVGNRIQKTSTLPGYPGGLLSLASLFLGTYPEFPFHFLPFHLVSSFLFPASNPCNANHFHWHAKFSLTFLAILIYYLAGKRTLTLPSGAH
jgi:hypothetical protein